MAGFADFDAGHRDLVSVTKFNFYGNRIVTASTDHRMKVWDQKDGEWQLVDTWRAHDAEIRDVSTPTAVAPGSFVFGLVLLCFNCYSGDLEWPFHGPAHWQRG